MNNSSQKLAQTIVKGMREKKGANIAVLDMRRVQNAVADFFVICSGNSDTQVDAITNAIEDAVFKELKEHPWKREGQQNGEWILLDYADTVAHVFRGEKRQHYSLENLWGDAEVTHIDD